MPPEFREAVENSIHALNHLSEDESMVLLIGGQDGIRCTLDTGTHEPTGVHAHMLAAHLRSIAEALDCSIADAAQLGVNAH